MQKITLHIASEGCFGTVVLKYFARNFLAALNANVASNTKGMRPPCGFYELASAPVFVKQDLRSQFGSWIIRLKNVLSGVQIAVIGGALQRGEIASTEGNSVRVSDETLEKILEYIESGSDLEIEVTEAPLGIVDAFRAAGWHNEPVPRASIRFVRPVRHRSRPVASSFYRSNFGSSLHVNPFVDDEFADWCAWYLYCQLTDNATVNETDFVVQETDVWQGFDGGRSGGGGAADSWGEQQIQTPSYFGEIVVPSGVQEPPQEYIDQTQPWVDSPVVPAQQSEDRYDRFTQNDVEDVPLIVDIDSQTESVREVDYGSGNQVEYSDNSAGSDDVSDTGY